MNPHYHCQITKNLIATEQAMPFITDDTHGATCHFLGVVRNHNDGKQVIGIDYEVCNPLATHMLEEIAQEVMKRYSPVKIYITHFEGYLAVGGVSMLVSTSAPHRQEAYQANRMVVEAIKHRVPIWKKEYYGNSHVEWVQGCKIEHIHD